MNEDQSKTHLVGKKPRDNETVHQFCNRVAEDGISKDEIINSLYYHNLITYTKDESIVWTDKAIEIFVGGNLDISEINRMSTTPT